MILSKLTALECIYDIIQTPNSSVLEDINNSDDVVTLCTDMPVRRRNIEDCISNNNMNTRSRLRNIKLDTTVSAEVLIKGTNPEESKPEDWVTIKEEQWLRVS